MTATGVVVAPASIESVRDFVLQLDKTLSARRLYAPGSAPHRDATAALFDKCRRAAGSSGFTIEFRTTDLLYERQSVLNKPRREEAFFFPLYRDGLRELTFSPSVSAEDLSALVVIFETKERDLSSADDTINTLWRADLSTIRHKAIDELDDIETSGRDDLRDLVEQLVEEIGRTTVPTTAPVSQIETNVREIGTDYAMIRSTFEGNVHALQVAADHPAAVRAELGEGRVQTLVERFIEILLVTVWVPFKSIDPALVAPILAQLIDGYWSTREYERASVLLTHVHAASQQAPSPVSRKTMRDVIERFLTPERLTTIVSEFERGVISPKVAAAVFELPPDAQLWAPLLDVLPRLTDPDARMIATSVLKRRLDKNGELMTSTLVSFDAARIRAALALLDEKNERTYAPQVIGLASHPDESIRLKGLKAAAGFGGPMALEVLWKAMESDPSKSVRLYAFRAISTANLPGLAARLESLVTSAEFANRPVWEREKYVRLLGTVAGAEIEPLFESWIPSKHLMWSKKDLETLEIALRGLGACGDSGYEKVQAMTTQQGKPGEIARKVIDSISRCEIGENTMMRGTLSNIPIPKPEKSS
ncbi:MAG TPA: HEAT repeat domain-containing protein [Thermoanaerobaculia bacterium]|nr:HEAT repeat domain-containing protein [Thermoanaerobaculia bacterium]